MTKLEQTKEAIKKPLTSFIAENVKNGWKAQIELDKDLLDAFTYALEIIEAAEKKDQEIAELKKALADRINKEGE